MIPEPRMKQIVKLFHRRQAKGERSAILVREIAQVCFSEGYAKAVIDYERAKNESKQN